MPRWGKKGKQWREPQGSLTVGSAEWVDAEKHLTQCLVVKCPAHFYSTFIYTFSDYNYITSSSDAGVICHTIMRPAQYDTENLIRVVRCECQPNVPLGNSLPCRLFWVIHPNCLILPVQHYLIHRRRSVEFCNNDSYIGGMQICTVLTSIYI